MPRAEDAPEQDVWWAGLRWVEAARMQVSRFEDVVYALVRAYADAETRARMDEPSESTAEWRAFYDGLPPRDDQRPETVPSYALLMQVSTELDLLVVAARNVLRAQRRLPDHLRDVNDRPRGDRTAP